MREVYFSNDGSIRAIFEGRAESGKTLFEVSYCGGYPVYEEHNVNLYEWAKHLHGNAPSGMPYGYFRASRNGKRVIITV